MVLILRTLIECWRARLDYLEQRKADGVSLPFALRTEMRILRYCLRRHADGTHAEIPSRAVPLSYEDAERSNRLYLRSEIPHRQVKAIVRDVGSAPGPTSEDRTVQRPLPHMLYPRQQVKVRSIRKPPPAKETNPSESSEVSSDLVLALVAMGLIILTMIVLCH